MGRLIGQAQVHRYDSTTKVSPYFDICNRFTLELASARQINCIFTCTRGQRGRGYNEPAVVSSLKLVEISVFGGDS